MKWGAAGISCDLMLFENGTQYDRLYVGIVGSCDLMLFENGTQLYMRKSKTVTGCDLMLFENGTQLMLVSNGVASVVI